MTRKPRINNPEGGKVRTALAVAMVILELAVLPVTARANGPNVSRAQIALARANTAQRAAAKCHAEETYTLIGYNPVTGTWKRRKVGHCENVTAGLAHQDPIARDHGKRRILVYATFHIHDKFGPTDGRIVEWRKTFSWWVGPPWMGFLFARESPVNPWNTVRIR